MPVPSESPGPTSATRRDWSGDRCVGRGSGGEAKPGSSRSRSSFLRLSLGQAAHSGDVSREPGQKASGVLRRQGAA